MICQLCSSRQALYFKNMSLDFTLKVSRLRLSHVLSILLLSTYIRFNRMLFPNIVMAVDS